MVTSTLELLNDLCERHDWFYHFSDDHKVWQRGNEQIQKIRDLMMTLQDEGFGQEAKKIYYKWKPEGVNFG